MALRTNHSRSSRRSARETARLILAQIDATLLNRWEMRLLFQVFDHRASIRRRVWESFSDLLKEHAIADSIIIRFAYQRFERQTAEAIEEEIEDEREAAEWGIGNMLIPNDD